jgi:hypothetical protein
MIAGIFVLPQALSSAALIFLLLRFPLEALLVLVFVFLEKIKRGRPLIPCVPYLSLYNVLLLLFLGPIARISLSVLALAA